MNSDQPASEPIVKESENNSKNFLLESKKISLFRKIFSRFRTRPQRSEANRIDEEQEEK